MKVFFSENSISLKKYPIYVIFSKKSQQIFFKPPRGVSGGVLEGTYHGGNADDLSACYKT